MLSRKSFWLMIERLLDWGVRALVSILCKQLPVVVAQPPEIGVDCLQKTD